jgi:hypothetical protein
MRRHITIACVVLTNHKLKVPINEILRDYGKDDCASRIHGHVVLEKQSCDLLVSHSVSEQQIHV